MTRAVLFAAVIMSALPATAKAAVSMQTSVSARRVEVGEIFYFKLSALSDGGQAPARPTLTAPAGINVSGPSVGSQTQMTIINGQMQQKIGLNATWQLTATKVGQFRIGPAAVEVGGNKVQGEVVSIEVVAAGSQPRRLPGSPGFDPFDLFDPLRRGRPFPGFGFGLEPDEEPDAAPQFPEEFRVEHAPDQLAFLRATLSPSNVVVGEQVTLRVYAYGNRGSYREASLSTEPSRGDFIGYQLGDKQDRVAYQVPIDGSLWLAAKIREYALFPIRTGALTAGQMKFGFDGRGYNSQGQFQGLVRICEPATVNVREPPLKGRPAGYKLGDVGDYELTAKVEPRDITQGESVSVIAKLEGVGNVPARLKLPERRGLSWGEPSVIDKVEPQGDVVQGFRVFTYVVRVEEAGAVDLGELTLPFWNPKKKAYEVARAKLDRLTVKANPQAVAKSELKAERDPLKDAIAVRKELGAAKTASVHIADRPWYWLLLFGAPLGVVISGIATRIGARLREGARARKHTHERLVGEALKHAATAADQGDHAATAGAIERALFTAIEGGSGLKARAVLKSELASTLTRNGYEDEIAERAQRLLQACDALRFTGAAEAGGARELLMQARDIADKLRRGPASRSRVAD